MYLLIVLCCLLLALTACGPQPQVEDNESLMEQTRQIALDYEVEGDLARARSDLAALDVANANQWLLLVAELSIRRGDEPAAADALAHLARDLGLSSVAIERQLGESPSSAGSEVPVSAEGEPVVVVEDDPMATASPTPTTAVEPSPTAPAAPDTPVPGETVVSPAETEARVETRTAMNVRAGPGTGHPIVGAMGAGDSAPITGRNPAGDWWQIAMADGAGWIYGPLVETRGSTADIAVAAAIPTPPPATPTPVALPTEPPAPAAPTATPVPAGPDFRLVGQRLWDVAENGGFLNGNSVNCGEKQVIRVEVIDAGGNPLNGVTVQGVYRNELHTSGEKGPGIVEFDVNVDGDDVVVLRDVDGRQVSSDRAKGLTAKTYNIPHDQLIQGRFCRDEASCQAFINTNGCFGHFSWTVRFQRSY